MVGVMIFSVTLQIFTVSASITANRDLQLRYHPLVITVNGRISGYRGNPYISRNANTVWGIPVSCDYHYTVSRFRYFRLYYESIALNKIPTDSEKA